MQSSKVLQGATETATQKYLVAVREPLDQFSREIDQMKEKHLQFIMLKQRPDRFPIGHNVGFQSFTHFFIATPTGQNT